MDRDSIRDKIAILSGKGNHSLDDKIIKRTSEMLGLSKPLSFTHLNMGDFPDGEPDLRIDDSKMLDGRHTIVMQSAHTAALYDQFMTLAWTAKNEHNAASVTGVLPFMWYRRQENPKGDEINRAKMAIDDMANKRFDHIIFCDIHSPRILDFAEEVNLSAENVDPSPLYADYMRQTTHLARREGAPFFIYSPDEGSVGRAVSLAKELQLPVAFNEKRRKHSGETEIAKNGILEKLRKKYQHVEIVEAGENLNGAYVCVREDEVSTGGTANMTAKALLTDYNVKEVFFCGTHPVCTPGWKRKFVDTSHFTQVYLGNTIPREYENSTGGRITTVDVSPVIAAALAYRIKQLFHIA